MRDTSEEDIPYNKEASGGRGVPTSKQLAIPLKNYLTDEVYYDTLHAEADRVSCNFWRCYR